MRHYDLFSGLGLFALAASWVWSKHEVVSFCESDEYCRRVLKKHWPDVPCVEDIRDVKNEGPTPLANTTSSGFKAEAATVEKEKGSSNKVGNAGELQRGSLRLGGSPGRIDLITGGFPCQPFSHAGKRDGRSDDRFLWKEMLRVIQLFKPRWVVAENVRGILSIEDGMVFEQVCLDLENTGYTVQAFIIPAVAVDAKHRRDRVWIVGHAKKLSERTRLCEREPGQRGRRRSRDSSNEIMANTTRKDDRNTNAGTSPRSEQQPRERGGKDSLADSDGPVERRRTWKSETEWFAESGMGRVSHGTANRVHRLRALGNAIVPQVAEQIFRAMKAVDEQHTQEDET